MSHHIKAALPMLTITLTLATGCSDYGEVLDPYADMDQGTDMSKVLIPDMPDDTRVDEAPDTTDMEQPDMPVIDALPAPKELQAVAEPTGITLTWLPARGAIRYEVRINGGPWKSTGSEMQFIHEDAPGGSVTSATITASDMTERPHVALEATDIVGAPGPEQTYEVRAVHEDGASMPSAPATASRPFEIATITWERQDEDSPDWLAIPDATGNSALDLTAAPEGDTHTYRALITPTAGQTYTSSSDTGARLAAESVTSSLYHSCALLNNGFVKCWGDNRFGQLGLNNKDNIMQDPSAYPIESVSLPEKVVQISVGSESVCARSETNKLYCWGQMADYEFRFEESNGVLYAEKVEQDDLMSLPSSHVSHLCYITTSDKLKCFGRNSQGQLGYGNTTNLSGVPIDHVPLITDVKSVAHSLTGTCALLSDNKVSCWGLHQFVNNGETIGDEADEMPPPVLDTQSMGQIVELSMNIISNTCMLNANNIIYCWGKGLNGELGSGNSNDVLAPGIIRSTLFEDPRLINFEHISTGLANVCTLASEGSVFCWGSGATGINGNGTKEHIGDDADDRLVPIPLGARASHLNTKGGVACAVVKGEVLCWGDNALGQLGRVDISLDEVIGDDPGEMPPQPVQLW